MCEIRFYICRHCGNIVGLIQNAGVPMKCCGENMELLVPGTVDASVEKHTPVVEVEGDLVKVSVGSVIHPMSEEHNIRWVYLQTEKGGQRKCFRPDEEPVAVFSVIDDKPVSVFAYCNLHGLWKTDI